jgi:hypothetical protein
VITLADALQWGLVGLMPFLGLGALVSLPGMIVQPLGWMAVLIAVSACLTMWSTLRTRAAARTEPGT